ncbi:hypothetical protein PAEH1_01545 [Paenalcaligenes hominis]|uniref:Tape measure protein N-terminal domain-containing protein n=1 Tax=Paenalcaligenes hominis TaxID=643674 RepID=A0A1U9JXM9_9BURK|nr:tape measure protein [Paenalcaligenes hominis]AQS50563.1 hypothetical protein PAEH1_01545 [Paenalcaligenes hominis]
MTQESRLSIVIDSRNAQVDAERLEQTLRDLESAGVRVTRSNTDTSGSMNRMASEADAAARAIKRGLVAALGGLSAMAVIDVADEWGQYASRIRMATKSAEEYEHVQKRMVKSAQATYRAINETRESFIQMSPVLRDMGLSLDQSIDAVDTFSGLLVVNGANAQRGAAAMEALAKSLQRGRIDAQAWMTIYSTVDNVVDLLAATTGKSTEEMRRLGIEGKISAEMIATALVQGNAQVLKSVESMPTTVRDAMQNINSAFGEYIGRTNETYQVTATLAEGLDLLGNNIDSVLNVAIVAAGAGLTAYSAKTTLALVETGKLTAAKIAEAAASRNSAIATEIYAKARLAEAQATVASATGMQRLTLVQTALIPAQRQLEAATKAVTVANRGLGASLLGLVGGPIGGITLAAGLAATAFLALRDSTEESKFSFDTLGESLDETIKKFRELNTAQREAALIQVERELESQAKELEDAYTKLIAKLHEVNGLRSDWSQDEWIDFRQRVVEAKEAGEDLLPLLLEMRETSGINPRFISDVIILNGGIDAARDKFGLFSERAAELKGELEGAASAQDSLNDSLKGLSDADFIKLLSGLQQSLDVIGMTAQQAAEYKARLEGANEEQARQAGFWANLIDIAQKLEGATKEKDAAAIKGAQELLNKLAEQEVQLRMNMARAAEYAAMMALGVEATLAAQGAETAAQLVGLKAQEEIVARIKAVTENISTNTRSSSKKAAEAAKKLADEVDNLVGSLYPAIQAEKEWVKSQKLLDQALKQGKITQEQHTKGLVKLQKAYELVAFAAPEHVKAIQDEAKSIKASIPSLRQRVETFGLSAAAISRSAEAETRARIATLNNIKAVEVAKGASKEYVKQIEQEIDALKELLIQQEHQTGLLDKGERQEAEQKYYQDMADTAKRAHEEIERSLTDALMRGFESGKDFGRNFIDTLKNMFGSLVLRPIIQPIAAGAAGMITGGFSSAANAQGTGGLLGLSSFSPFTGFAGSSAGLVQSVGGSLASINGSLGDFGANLVMNADKIGGALDMAGAGIAYGASLYQLTQGKWGAGLGGAAGQLLGGPIGSFIGSQLGGMLDKAFKGETRHGAYMQYDLAARQAVAKGGPSGGYGGQATIDAATQLFGSTVDTINSVLEGVGAKAQTAWFHGMFESSDKGRGGTFAGGSIQLGDGSIVDFGTNKKGDGFGGKSGTAEEMFANLQSEVHFAALEAWKAVGSEMPQVIRDMLAGVDVRSLTAEQAQGLVSEISATVGAVNALSDAFNQMPLENLKNLSFDVAHGLGMASGGLDALSANVASFYQGFYSEAERQEHLHRQLVDTLGAVNMQLPSSREGFRQLVDSLGEVTEANQHTIAALLGAASAADQYYAELERRQAEAYQERQRLEQETYNSARSHVDKLMSAFKELAQKQIRELEQVSKSTDKVANALQKSLNTQISSLTSVSSMLTDMVNELRGGAKLFEMQSAEGWRVIGNTISTGVLPDADKLRSAVGSIRSDLDDRYYGSIFERQRDQLVLANQLDSINSLAKPQLTIAEQQLQVMQDQLAELREGTKRAFELAGLSQAQIAAIKSVDDKTAANVGLTQDQLEALRTGNNASAVLQNLTREQIQGILGVKSETSSLHGLSQSQIDAMRAVDLNTQSVAELIKHLQTAFEAEKLASKQIETIQSQLGTMQAQYEQLRGLNLSMTSLDEGMRLLAVAMKAEQAAKPPASGQSTSFGGRDFQFSSQSAAKNYLLGNTGLLGSFAEEVAKGWASPTDYLKFAQLHYSSYGWAENRTDKPGENKGRTHKPGVTSEAQAYLAANQDVMTAYLREVKSGGAAGGDRGMLAFVQSHFDQYGRHEMPLRKYARGGDHFGGLRLVGELGPELEVTGPSRIFNANKTQDILRNMSAGPDISGLMQSLLRENQQLRQMYENMMRSMIAMQQRMARVLERWEGDDYPVRVEEMPVEPVVVKIKKEVA